jgi:lysine-N-methylase
MDRSSTSASPALPERPRLASHVAPRRHVVGGSTVVVLHDLDLERLATIGAREWMVLSCADGTRDLDGIALCAAQQGHPVLREHVVAFMEELAAAGMLASGPPPPLPAAAAGSDAPASAAMRPVVPLPGYRFRCDGRGACCRTFPSTLFSAIETVRARALAPMVLDAAARPEQAFTPERGSVISAQRACAVTMVDGRCAYLGSTGRCTLHEAGGPEGKPLGCRFFPVCVTDDGTELRLSVMPECACVLASLEGAGGGPLAAGLRTGADLPGGAVVERLAAELAPAAGRSWTRRQYLEWATALEKSGATTAGADVDVPRLYVSLAAGLELHADDPVAAARAGIAGAADADPLTGAAAELGRLDAALARRVELDGGWRSARDVARVVPRLMRAALAILRAGSLPTPDAGVRAREHLCLRAVFHAHRWALEGEPVLAEGLRARAARLLAARCLPACYSEADTADPAFAEPIALVEAVARGFSL